MFGELLHANRHYAGSFSLAGLEAGTVNGFGLVTCIDSRIEPLAVVGLVPGDAKVGRNVGARVTSDVRCISLVLAKDLLGVTEIALMHHSLCALAGRTNEDLRSLLPPAGAAATDDMEFLAMLDPDAALAAHVAAVRKCAALARGVRVGWWRYRVEDGLVERIIRS